MIFIPATWLAAVLLLETPYLWVPRYFNLYCLYPTATTKYIWTAAAVAAALSGRTQWAASAARVNSSGSYTLAPTVKVETTGNGSSRTKAEYSIKNVMTDLYNNDAFSRPTLAPPLESLWQHCNAHALHLHDSASLTGLTSTTLQHCVQLCLPIRNLHAQLYEPSTNPEVTYDVQLKHLWESDVWSCLEHSPANHLAM